MIEKNLIENLTVETDNFKMKKELYTDLSKNKLKLKYKNRQYITYCPNFVKLKDIETLFVSNQDSKSSSEVMIIIFFVKSYFPSYRREKSIPIIAQGLKMTKLINSLNSTNF